jgi:hypothetical protein
MKDDAIAQLSDQLMALTARMQEIGRKQQLNLIATNTKIRCIELLWLMVTSLTAAAPRAPATHCLISVKSPGPIPHTNSAPTHIITIYTTELIQINLFTALNTLTYH